MSKKVIRLNEQDIERLVRKIVKEDSINELGGQDFTKPKPISNPEQGQTLRPAIAELKGENHIVVIDKSGKIIGYGPAVGNMKRGQICKIAQHLIDEWEEEIAMNELDRPDFGGVQPITFCSK